ncbi:MAG TPA: peptide deformylase [Pyrinomonadaceae bacterium]|jgi:peptide deformylase|nr:peptide deformylase [Pyrinomonadaceae bacterium]
MALLKIVSYPASVLAEMGAPVETFDDALEKLVSDMFETMYAAHGVGLAAPQVGLSLQLFVMDCEGTKIVAANPVILNAEGEQDGDEACLSLASIGALLRRPDHVLLRAQDAAGRTFETEGRGLTARCLAHETDHCNGMLFIDRLSPLKRDIVKRKFRKAIKSER